MEKQTKINRLNLVIQHEIKNHGCCATWDICRKLILKIKSCEISFFHNICGSYSIVLKFCTEHGSHTVVLCPQFQDDLIIQTDVMGKWDFVRFAFKRSFGRMSYTSQGPALAEIMAPGTSNPNTSLDLLAAVSQRYTFIFLSDIKADSWE